MIYNKIERASVITKWRFNYYNTDFSLEITSKVQNFGQKHTFTHKLTNKQNFQMPSLFFLLNHHGMERTGLWDIKGIEGYIYAAFKSQPDEGISGGRKWMDLNVPCCRPTLKCVLRRQHGKCWTQSVIQWVFRCRVISVSRFFWTVRFELDSAICGNKPIELK